MEYQQAHEVASKNKVPIRRASWPQGHHAEHVNESTYRLHTDHPTPQDWTPSQEDRSANDWEQHQEPQGA